MPAILLGEYDVQIPRNILGNKARTKKIIIEAIISIILFFFLLWLLCLLLSCLGCKGCVDAADACHTCDGTGCGTYCYNLNKKTANIDGDKALDSCLGCILCD